MPRRTAVVLVLAALLLAAALAGSAGAAEPASTLYLPLLGSQPPGLAPAARLSGYVGPAAASGSSFYLAAGSGLQVLSPGGAAPRQIGAAALPVSPLEVQAVVPSGRLLYVIAQRQLDPVVAEGLILTLDLDDPAAPRLLTTTSVPRGFGYNAVAVVGADRLSVRAGDELLIFDLGRPTAPSLAFRGNQFGYSPQIAAYGRYLYIADRPALDLADPAAPRPVGQALPNTGAFGDRRAIAVVGHVLYITTAEDRIIAGQRCFTTRLQAYSLADPTAPIPAGFVRVEAAGPNPADWPCAPLAIEAAGPGRIMLSDRRLMQVVDTGDPLRPRAGELRPLEQVAEGDLAFAPQYGAVAGTTLLLPRYGQVLAYDLADPAAVQRLPPLRPQLPVTIQRVLRGDASHAVVVGDTTFSLLNVADPAAPRIVGAEQRLEAGSALQDAAVAGDRLFTLEYSYSAQISTLRILSGVTAGALRQLGALPIAEQTAALALRGAHAYVLTDVGLLVVDVADPAQPRVAHTLPLLSAGRMALDGDVLLVRVRAGDLRTEDLTLSLADPIRPVEAARAPSEHEWIDLPGERPLAYAQRRASCGENCAGELLQVVERAPGEPPGVRGTLALAVRYWRAPSSTRFSVGRSLISYSTSEGCVPNLCRGRGTMALIDTRNPDLPRIAALGAVGAAPQDHALVGRTLVAGYGASGLALFVVPSELP